DTPFPRCASCAVRYWGLGCNRKQTGVPIASSRETAAQDAPDAFRHCLRERSRLARERAALRAGFATVAEHYERVIRTMLALGPTLGIELNDIGHPTDPQRGPAALLMYGDDRFLKHEQAVLDRLLRKLPD